MESPILGPRTSDHSVSAEDLCKTAFQRRNLMETPVVKWPRKNNKVLIADASFMGSRRLEVSYQLEFFMSKDAVGVQQSGPESWWIASHGKWCPSY